ncbi:glycosyltransferase [Frigidibacter sp. MR17.24]|uniref:glycosyltransferase n=1 Tax=Frigidibacter sp. MR17.24 TaxID=3127345 RepID=UPI0030131AE0
MTNKSLLGAAIALVRQQIAAGDLAGARARLQATRVPDDAADPAARTALGLPRRLQSTWLRLAKAEGDAVARLGLQALAVPPPELLAPLFPPLGACPQDETAVPPVLHQVWIGGPAPVTVAAWAAHAARHGWHHRLWDEAALAAEGIAGDPLFVAMRARGDLPGAVDVARYAILARHGGVYLDCDWMPARPDLGPGSMVPATGLSALAEATPRLTHTGTLLLGNALIAAPPGHPVLRLLVDRLPQVAALLPGQPAWWVTGPLPFTLAARGAMVRLLPAATVAGQLPDATPLPEVEAAVAANVARQGGALYAWKSWGGGGGGGG